MIQGSSGDRGWTGRFVYIIIINVCKLNIVPASWIFDLFRASVVLRPTISTPRRETPGSIPSSIRKDSWRIWRHLRKDIVSSCNLFCRLIFLHAWSFPNLLFSSPAYIAWLWLLTCAVCHLRFDKRILLLLLRIMFSNIQVPEHTSSIWCYR